MREFLDNGYENGRWFCYDGTRTEVRRILRWLVQHDVPCEYTEDYEFIRIMVDDVDYILDLVA